MQRAQQHFFPFSLFFSIVFFSFSPPAAIPHPSVGSGLWCLQHRLAMYPPSLSWQTDPRGEKEQTSSLPLSAFLGHLPETQSAVYERYPFFSRRGEIPASSTPLSKTHLWVLSTQLNTCVASLRLSLTWPELFLNIPCWMTLRSLANFSIFFFLLPQELKAIFPSLSLWRSTQVLVYCCSARYGRYNSSMCRRVHRLLLLLTLLF